MLLRKHLSWFLICQGLGLLAPTQLQAAIDRGVSDSARAPSTKLLERLEEDTLHGVATEVLERDPSIARARKAAAAAAARVPQARALPDPVAMLGVFLEETETRVGPQRFSLSIRQKFPGFGKLDLREQAALFEATAAEAHVEQVRLDVLYQVRRLGYELMFVRSQTKILEIERATLIRFERAAQARYAAGTGLQQEIVRIQAQITRADTRLLEIAQRSVSLTTALNALRRRPAREPIETFELPSIGEFESDLGLLMQTALQHRPDLAASEAKIASETARADLAGRASRPDVTLGLSFTSVGRRDDPAGRMNPPASNGDDALALTGAVNLPIWRRKIAAGIEEAEARLGSAQEVRQQVLVDIERTVGDLAARIPLLMDHIALLETVLRVQANESLRSAETAYSTGKLSAVDLLDAEVVLFEVQLATARVRADIAIARADLERAIAHPISPSVNPHLAEPRPRVAELEPQREPQVVELENGQVDDE